MNELAIIEPAIEPTATIDEIAETRTKLEGMKKRINDALDVLDDQMIAWIKTNDKPIEWVIDGEGNVRKFWIGDSSSTKCKDPAKVFNFLISLSVDDALCCLSSSAWKHGAFKKVLEAVNKPELYDECFEKVYKEKIESNAPKEPKKEPKQLQSIDTRWI